MSEPERLAEQIPGSPAAEMTSGEGVAVAELSPDEPLFDAEELAEFNRDDVAAGGNICRMLALFFFYTVVVMALSGWWTYLAVFK